ncbi:CPBP family intramembrane glutamic endopeptidase [Kineococcus sp. SYSU DK004]|uniref:CPBP family intramembrane glutamic endopeptidase n=1 Tax=Kineococcus sp. SYSU DK004 TaxID=3383125 RepID=UPI003D7CC59B
MPAPAVHVAAARRSVRRPARRPARTLALARRHPVATFAVLALAATWAVWVPRALHTRGALHAPWAVDLGAGWSYAPAAAAVAAAALVSGRPGLRELARRLVRWRVGARWWAVALGAPPLAWGLTGAAHLAAGGAAGPVRPPALGAGIGGAVLLLLLLCLTDGVGEETGWRGWALPRLLERTGAAAATPLLAALWTVWHLPLTWTAGTALAGAPVPVLLAELVVAAALHTALHLRTGGSALLAVVLHASANLFALPPPARGGSWTAWLLCLGLEALIGAAVWPRSRTGRRGAPVRPTRDVCHG